MIKYILLITFCSGLSAAPIGAKKVVEKIVKQNLMVKSLHFEEDEQLALSRLVLAPYDYYLSLEGNSLRDKSIQDSPASPSNMDKLSYALALSKKWSLGVQTKLSLTNDDLSYSGINFATLNAARYIRNKSFLGASVVIDLSQNIGGRIDRILLNNMEDQNDIIGLGNQQKIESYLLSGLMSFYRLTMAREGKKLFKEMEVNARKLLKKAEKRRKRGIVDNRALFIYRSNLSTTKKNLLASVNQLESSVVSFNSFLKDFGSNFWSENIINDNEYKIFKDLQRIDVKKEAKKLRTILIKKSGLKIEQRKLNSYSYQRLPTVNFTLSAMGTGNQSDFSSSFEQASNLSKPQYMMGVKVSYPLGGGANAGNYQAQKNRVRRVELEFNEDLRNKERELAQKITELSNLFELTRVTEVHMKNEKQKYENEMKEYARGRSGAKDVVQFQNEYLSASLGKLEAVVNFKMAFNGLLFQLGRFCNFYEITIVGAER